MSRSVRIWLSSFVFLFGLLLAKEAMMATQGNQWGNQAPASPALRGTYKPKGVSAGNPKPQPAKGGGGGNAGGGSWLDELAKRWAGASSSQVVPLSGGRTVGSYGHIGPNSFVSGDGRQVNAPNQPGAWANMFGDLAQRWAGAQTNQVVPFSGGRTVSSYGDRGGVNSFTSPSGAVNAPAQAGQAGTRINDYMTIGAPSNREAGEYRSPYQDANGNNINPYDWRQAFFGPQAGEAIINPRKLLDDYYATLFTAQREGDGGDGQGYGGFGSQYRGWGRGGYGGYGGSDWEQALKMMLGSWNIR